MSFPPSKAKRSSPPRRGAAVVLVMLMVSVTLATAYALVWSQGSSLQIQQNATLRARARGAALTGLSIALRKMHERDWLDADETIDDKIVAGALSGAESYEVGFKTGDETLDPADPDEFVLWPYRVTVTSTGHAAAADGPQAEHRVQAVVQLVPRSLAAPPKAWGELAPQINGSNPLGDIQPPTLTQYRAGDAELSLPLRIQGSARFRSWLNLGTESQHDWRNDVRRQYLADLNEMLKDENRNYGDYRPLSDRVTLPLSLGEQASDTEAVLASLSAKPEDGDASFLDGWESGDAIKHYRLYPGGKLYTVENMPGSPRAPLTPDPKTNPAGIFRANGQLKLSEDVTIYGTLIGRRDIEVSGGTLQFRPAPLLDDDGSSESVFLALDGTSDPVELPALIVGGDLQIEDDGQVEITGMVSIWETLKIESDGSSKLFDLTGQVVLRNVEIEPSASWERWDRDEWDDLFYLYRFMNGRLGESEKDDWRIVSLLIRYHWGLQYLSPAAARYFPLFAQACGVDLAPRVELRPRNVPIRYHWPRDGQPIYDAHPDDDGLRWKIVRWQDGVK